MCNITEEINMDWFIQESGFIDFSNLDLDTFKDETAVSLSLEDLRHIRTVLACTIDLFPSKASRTREIISRLEGLISECE